MEVTERINRDSEDFNMAYSHLLSSEISIFVLEDIQEPETYSGVTNYNILV